MKSNRSLCTVFCVVVALATIPAARGAFMFTDSFEGAAFDPFWTLGQQNGSIALSMDRSHTGAQSAKFSSTPGDRFLTLTHTYPSLMTGMTSVYFYDVAPGQQTLYELLQLYDSHKYPAGLATVGTQDFDASCYTANINGLGPNANCGSFPQQLTTNIPRTAGWHLLSLTLGGTTGSSISVDGQQVYSTSATFTFDTVSLDVQGPSFRPDTVAYFDDFSITATPLVSAPEPSTLSLVIAALASGGLFRRFRRGGTPSK